MINEKERKIYVDMAKGIGILLVIYSHAMTGENRAVSWACTFFMPMFFICSGLCYSKPKSFLENFKKTLFPYYIWGGIGLGIEICFLVIKSGIDVSFIIQKAFNFLFGISMWNYPLWFLVAFFVCKCVFDEIIFASQEKKYRLYIRWSVVFICFAVGLCMARIKKEYNFFFPFRGDVGITMLPFMLLGYYSKKWCEEINKRKSVLKRLLFVSILLVINIISFHYNSLVSVNSSDYGNPILFFIGAVSGSYFVILCCQIICKISLLEIPLLWFGRNSLTIMCCHAIILMVIAKTLMVTGCSADVSMGLFGVIKFICCVFAMIPICFILKGTMKKGL